MATLSIKIDPTGAKQGARVVKREMADISREADKAERSTDRLGRTANDNFKEMARGSAIASKGLSGIASAAALALTGVLALAGSALSLQKFVSASVEAQKVQAQLGAALKSTGGVAGQTIASLNDHAAALQRVTTYGDEAVNTAQGLLLTFTKIRGDTFPKATTAVLNMATAMGTDLKSAAIQVGKALNDPVLGMTALSRSGITFSEAQKEMVKSMVASNDMLGAQNLILKELETQFGGSAEAARNTLGGALSALGNAWGDLFEKSSGATEGLRRAIEGLVTAISSPGFTAFIGAIGTTLLAALTAAAMAANVLVSGMAILGDNLDVIGVAAATAGSLMLVAFGPAIFSGIVSGFVAMGSAGVAAISAITAAMAANPLGALIVGITVAVTAAYYFRDEIKQAIGIDVVQTAKDAANFIIGVFVGSFNAIVATFGKLPAAFGDLAYQAGYQFADHIRYWINEAILLIDSFITTMNDKLGTSIARPSVLRPVGYNNPFAGAASDAASTAAAAFNGALDVDYIGMIGKAFESATPAVQDFSGALGGAADEAEKLGGASGKAAKTTKKAFKHIETEAEKAAKALENTLGSTLASLFDGPIKDADDFFDKLTSGFAGLAQQNISKLFEGTFSASTTAANDNDRWAGLRTAVEKGSEKGTAAGGFKGFISGFQTMFGGGQQQGASGQGAGGALGAGLGGFSLGYQAQSPGMGALGGFLSGLATGNPIMAVVGGIAGALGGIFGGNSARKKERAEANSQLNQNTATIEQLFAAGQGKGIGEYANAVREFYDETAKIDEIAQKAGDDDLVKRLRQNFNDFFLLMEKDFVRGWSGMVDALNDGLGSNSPFVKGKESIEGLRDELKNFVADTQAMGDLQIKHGRDTDAATVAAQVEEAQQAAQTMALAVLGGAKTLSTMEAEVLRLDGVAAGLQVTLEELGMSAETAGDAISSSLDVAVAKLRDTFRNDINASINELSGFSFLNDIAEAQIKYQQRLSDAAALGLDGSLAARELSLALQDVVNSAGLTSSEIAMLSEAFPALAGMISTSVQDAVVSVASAQADLQRAYDAQVSAIEGSIDGLERWIDTARKFRASMRLSAVSPLSQADQTAEALKQFRDTAALAAGGDEAARDRLFDVGQAALDEARAYYASSESYFQIWQEIDRTVADMESSAGRQLTESQKQLAALNAQVSGLVTINDSVLSVTAAIMQLSSAESARAGALASQIAAMSSSGSDAIGAAYQSSLGRAGGASEIAYWQSQISAGKSVDWAVSAIANSPEAQALKSIRGFASGGYTGDMGTGQVSGVVHGGEFVAHAEATKRWRPELEAMNRGNYARGGSDNSAVVAELREIRSELAGVRAENAQLRKAYAAAAIETTGLLKQGNAEMAEVGSALKKVISR